MDRLENFFGGRRGPLRLALLALLWSLPALGLGLQTDDHLMRWAVAQGGSPFALYRIAPSFLASRRLSGFFPWWTSPTYGVSFFRPLTSLTHFLEFTLYPAQPALMLLVNVVLYAALVGVAAALYRRLLPTPRAATLAGLMFALDEAHAQSVGWIAGRNTLLTTLFSLLALHFYLRGREARNVALSALSVGLALLSGEAGLWSLAFLLSAAWTEYERPVRARFRPLLPQLAVGLSWAGVYVAGEFGARGSSWYRDPGAPLSLLSSAIADLPLWIVGLLGPSGMSFSIFYPPTVARLVALPLALLLGWLLWPTLRKAKESRLLASIALLSLAPVVFTVPSARVLFGSSFGAFGLIALAVAQPGGGSARARWTRRTFVVVHVWLALFLYQVALRSTWALEGSVHALAEASEGVREVVLLRSPLELLPSYALCLDTTCGDPRTSQRSLHQLYSGGSALEVARTAPDELELSVVRGWGETPIEGIYCAHSELPRAGEERDYGVLHARVIASLADGRPTRVRFRFSTPLESTERTFLTWLGTRPVPWQPPPVGGRTLLPALDVPRAFAP